FTWSASRLDRNLITVITGQVVETFDQQFRDLYLTSRGISLSKVSMADEPIPDPIQHAAPAPMPASIARKLINPKYALVTTGNHASPTSSGQNSSNKNSASQNPLGLKMLKGRIKQCVEEPPLHPGLAHLEKAYLIPYLPTWPEPDPPSDVIGFINIRDDKRTHQVHLQRSERFETSQAIRFSTPFTPAPQPDKQAPEKIHTDAKPSESTDRDRGQESGAQPVLTATPSPPEPDEMDSTGPPEQIDVPRDLSPPKVSRLKDTCGSLPSPPPQGTSEPTPEEEALPAATTPPPVAAVVMAPPVPKPRTLQLVIEPASPLTKSGQPQISLVRKIHIPQMNVPEASEESASGPRGRLASRRDTEDKDSGDGSQDST
ncbi:hypothetical protein CRUP_006407, partial [Coryphaenoides rupestris]